MLTAREIRSLLSKLCVDLGFCLPSDAEAQLEERPPSSIGEFTDAVFIAEGLDPATADRHLYRQVRSVIAEAFQASDEKRVASCLPREPDDAA